jgi:SsrA-binding protein
MAKKDTGKSKSKGKDADPDVIHLIASNRRARHEYDLLEKVEAGLVLTGTEVKSLRQGKANLEDSYAEIDKGEAWLLSCDIPEYAQGTWTNHKSKRPRKLLLHRREIERLSSKGSDRGLTIVPLRLYFKKGMAKVEICLARGRKLHDKREAIKTSEAKREMSRILRSKNY